MYISSKLEKDYGLFSFGIIMTVYHFLSFVLCFLLLDEIYYQNVLCMFLGILGLILPQKLYKKEGELKIPRFFYSAVLIAMLGQMMWFTYIYIGDLNRTLGGLVTLDETMYNFDLLFFKKSCTEFIYEIFGNLGFFSTIFYDFLMYAYMSYFIWPYLVVFFVLFSNKKEDEKKQVLNDYIVSFCTAALMIFTLYLIFPTTGPQYYLTKEMLVPFPFSQYGHKLYLFIRTAQTNFIDCFPSGHAGLSILVTIWYFHLNLPFKYVVTIFTAGITIATVALGYHYSIDILGSLPIVAICYWGVRYAKHIPDKI